VRWRESAMTSNWQDLAVRQLETAGILLVQDGNHGEYRPRREELVADGTPHIRAADIGENGAIDFGGAQRINNVALGRIKKGVGARGDVLLTHKGTVGRLARVPADAPHFVCSPQTTFWRSLDGDQLDQAFLFGYMRSPAFGEQLRARMHESDMAPYVSLTAQRSFAVALPPIAEQRRIGSVLSVFDDKIDSNRRLASLLEGIAAALFRARLADFIGVEDFEEAEIGLIPRGWTTGSLTSLARFINGRAFTKDANAKGRPILRIKELNAGVRDDTLRTDLIAAEEHTARHRDILFAWSGSLGVYRWSGPESLINQHIFKVIPEGYPPWFVYQSVRRHMPEFEAIARDKATTMGHIQRRHLSEARVALPDSDTLARVSDLLEPLDQWQGILASEIASLAATRDALLPKLISGEIRVPDAMDSEEVIGTAAEQLEGAKA
jgi:type I restriction enzyme, S subunit